MLADQMCVMLYVWLATSTINDNTRFAGKAPITGKALNAIHKSCF